MWPLTIKATSYDCHCFYQLYSNDLANDVYRFYANQRWPTYRSCGQYTMKFIWKIVSKTYPIVVCGPVTLTRGGGWGAVGPVWLLCVVAYETGCGIELFNEVVIVVGMVDGLDTYNLTKQCNHSDSNISKLIKIEVLRKWFLLSHHN